MNFNITSRSLNAVRRQLGLGKQEKRLVSYQRLGSFLDIMLEIDYPESEWLVFCFGCSKLWPNQTMRDTATSGGVHSR
jgi:hypothetical protein